MGSENLIVQRIPVRLAFLNYVLNHADKNRENGDGDYCCKEYVLCHEMNGPPPVLAFRFPLGQRGESLLGDPLLCSLPPFAAFALPFGKRPTAGILV